MAGANNEFTNVTRLVAEAIGEPGKRTFRVVVDSGSSTAAVWLEKDQLLQLALGIQQILGSESGQRASSGTPPVEREATGLTRLDFKTDKLTLGHDAERNLFVIDAYDQEQEYLDIATLRIWINLFQIEQFTEEALRVCAAGRPICPLCQRPINPDGHVCPRVNGHAKSFEFQE